MLSLHAGLDWTATPSLNEPIPYGPGIVAVEDGETLESAFALIRNRFGINGEIKGHDSAGDVLAAVFESLIECEARVGVLLLDKTMLLANRGSTLPTPAVLRHQMGCRLIERFIEKHALARLICDEDIRGKREWDSFRTDVLRINRLVRPNQKMKVAAWPSHKSALVQAADCLAYVYSRSIRGGGLDTAVRDRLRVLQAQSDNLFVVVQRWDET